MTHPPSALAATTTPALLSAAAINERSTTPFYPPQATGPPAQLGGPTSSSTPDQMPATPGRNTPMTPGAGLHQQRYSGPRRVLTGPGGGAGAALDAQSSYQALALLEQEEMLYREKCEAEKVKRVECEKKLKILQERERESSRENWVLQQQAEVEKIAEANLAAIKR